MKQMKQVEKDVEKLLATADNDTLRQFAGWCVQWSKSVASADTDNVSVQAADIDNVSIQAAAADTASAASLSDPYESAHMAAYHAARTATYGAASVAAWVTTQAAAWAADENGDWATFAADDNDACLEDAAWDGPSDAAWNIVWDYAFYAARAAQLAYLQTLKVNAWQELKERNIKLKAELAEANADLDAVNEMYNEQR